MPPVLPPIALSVRVILNCDLRLTPVWQYLVFGAPSRSFGTQAKAALPSNAISVSGDLYLMRTTLVFMLASQSALIVS